MIKERKNTVADNAVLQSLVDTLKNTLARLSDYDNDDLVVDIHLKTDEERAKDEVAAILSAVPEISSPEKPIDSSKIDNLRVTVSNDSILIKHNYSFYYKNRFYEIRENYFGDYTVIAYTAHRSHDELSSKRYTVSLPKNQE